MKLPQTTLLIILIIALFTSGITAATQPDTTLYIDPPEFTLNEQSEGCGYYVPWYSQHHYNIDGTATITFPNKSTILIDPRTQTQEKPHATVSRIFELPNGAGAFPGDNALTATYDDDPILWVTFDPGLPKLKDDSNHPTPAAGDPAPSWVEWITITPPHHTKYQSFTTRWTVPENPPITKDKPDPYITNRGSGNVFFIFNGFESKTNAVLSQGFTSGIVQPILIWNCGTIHPTKKTCTGYPKDEHWSIAAWADFNSASTHGTPMPTHPGNTHANAPR